MLLNKENILSRTHYGLTIYAWVLRQYSPRNTLKLHGNTCDPVHSPFNSGKMTLHIWIEDGCARHRDLELTNIKGDVFDFAAHYFRPATNSELYYQINQVMKLGLKIPAEENLLAFLDSENTIPEFSIFKAPISNIIPSEVVSLKRIAGIIRGNVLKQLTDNYRQVSNPKQKRKFKATYFHYVCFSGVFRKRADNQLLEHSGLLCLDFDHLEELDLTRQLLLKDPWLETQLLFTSPSGDGLKWIISIDTDLASHRDYFNSVSNYLKHTYSLQPDPSGKDVSRACFLCHDPTAYLNQKYTSTHQPFHSP